MESEGFLVAADTFRGCLVGQESFVKGRVKSLATKPYLENAVAVL